MSCGAPDSVPFSSPFEWWKARRPRYNIGLVIAGILAFVLYVIVCVTLLPRVIDPAQIDVNGLTTLVQGISYLFMMGVANVCYFLGPLSELVLRPRNVERYRRVCFLLGFWFSFLLPFCIPAGLTVLVLFFPDYFKAMNL